VGRARQRHRRGTATEGELWAELVEHARVIVGSYPLEELESTAEGLVWLVLADSDPTKPPTE
jgi:hypothetical protein